MTPGAPTIVGVLTTCSRTVRLQGLLQNAAARVLVDGSPVELGRATWPDQVFDLPAGTSLRAGSQVRTQQTAAGVASAVSSLALTVSEVANPLPVPLVVSPLISCASLVVVDGLTPDATVTVRDSSGTTRGTATSLGSSAVVALAGILDVGEIVTVAEDSCGSLATASSLPAEAMGRPGAVLPDPVFDGGVHDCQRVLSFSGLRPGTTLTLTRGDGSMVTFDCTRDTLHGRVDPPIAVAEKLSAQVTATPRCEQRPSRAVEIVSSSARLTAPRVAARPCPESALIQLSGLTLTATVRLSRGGLDLVEFGAAAETSVFDLAGTGFQIGDSIDVTQDLCGTRSDPATFVVQAPASTVTLDFTEKPVRCARMVLVEGVPEGSLVRVSSEKIVGDIGWAVGDGSTLEILVVPPLLQDDVVKATVTGCASGSISARVEEPTLDDPVITRAVEGERSLRLDQLLPGSVVDVRSSRGDTLLSSVALSRSGRFATNRPLVGRETLLVVARWCEQTRSGGRKSVDVRRPITLTRSSQRGIQNEGGFWNSGRMTAVLPLSADHVLAGGEWTGVWDCTIGSVPTPVSLDWDDPRVLSLAADPTLVGRYFAGTLTGLRYTDPTTSPIPFLTWAAAATVPAAEVHDVLVAPAHGLLVLATSAGLWSCPLSGFPTAAFTLVDPVLGAGFFRSLALGPGDSVIAYRSDRSAGNGRIIVGSGATGGLTWADRTPRSLVATTRAARRLNTIVNRMANGDLSSSPLDRSRVFLVLEDRTTNGWLPLVRSDDGGLTWVVPTALSVTADKASGLASISGLQAERNLVVVPSATDRDTVLVAGRHSGLFGSTDAGATWDVPSWPDTGDDFHGDVLAVSLDPSDPTGLTVWAGSDGGLYRSTDGGHTWDSTLNRDLPTLMFDTWGLNTGHSMSVDPADVEVIAGGLQDNGLVYLPKTGALWRSIVGGDGKRAKFVADDAALLVNNEGDGIRWMHWDGSGFSQKSIVNPPGTIVGTNDPIMSRVVSPVFGGPGHRMVAVASDDDQPGAVYGLFDDKPGTADSDRFSWRTIVTLTGTVRALGSWDGREILASVDTNVEILGIDTDVAHTYRIDTASATFVEMPTDATTPSRAYRFITALGASSFVALDDAGITETTDLLSWHRLFTNPGGAFWALDVDRNVDPATLLAGRLDALSASFDHGATWTTASGLPPLPSVVQVEVVPRETGSRLTIGTWNWSTWFADLQ